MADSSIPIPSAFSDRMEGSLGAEFPAFMRALEHPAEGLRVNSLRLSASDFERIAPFPVTRAPFPQEAFLLDADRAPGRHPYHAAGLYYLQDPGAMVVGAVVAPQPGEKVLDLSAAPGGKATHVAALMQGRGVLVANDVNASRARDLLSNIERCGVRNAFVTSESPQRLANHFGAWFDRVLVDAPCSGESMFHKSAAARADWSVDAVAGCARRQDELLDVASRLVAPGGRLIYSTCTFSREENEEVLERFLEHNPMFSPAPLPTIDGGTPVTIGRSTGGTIRLWPHHFPGAGHFIAVLAREPGDPDEVRPDRMEPLERAGGAILQTFVDDLLPEGLPAPHLLRRIGEKVYLLPEESPDTAPLRVLRSGLLLGTLQRGRFEPAHALALAAPAPKFARCATLESGDPRVQQYLRGHPIEHEGPPGWLPVAVDGFSLGWGKRVGRTIKNHYPKGLRQRGEG